METRVESVFAMGADQARSEFDAQVPGKGGRRNSEDEQEQGKASRAGALKEGTPASSSELDLPRVRGAHGECGGAGKSGADNERKRPLSNFPQVDLRWKRMHSCEIYENYEWKWDEL